MFYLILVFRSFTYFSLIGDVLYFVHIYFASIYNRTVHELFKVFLFYIYIYMRNNLKRLHKTIIACKHWITKRILHVSSRRQSIELEPRFFVINPIHADYHLLVYMYTSRYSKSEIFHVPSKINKSLITCKMCVHLCVRASCVRI